MHKHHINNVISSLNNDLNNNDIKKLTINFPNFTYMGEDGKYDLDKDKLVAWLLANQAVIQSTFHNNEFLKIHIITGQIVGIRATDNESHKPVLDYKLRMERGSDGLSLFIDLGEVDNLYNYLLGEKND